MLSLNIDEENGIIMLEPKEALSKADFESAARIIDPYLEHNDNFIGLVVHAKSFPGWDSFAALISHLRFVKEHHKKFLRVAFSTNSAIGKFAESVARHFINAEIKNFSHQDLKKAKSWIVQGSGKNPAK
jgi:hypothetical protein